MWLILTTITAIYPHPNEGAYVDAYCAGVVEYMLPDRTRVDCLLPDEAQEYDFGKKWAEGLGQALWYAMNTGRRAAVVYIVENNSDQRGVERAKAIVKHYNLPITVRVLVVQVGPPEPPDDQ